MLPMGAEFIHGSKCFLFTPDPCQKNRHQRTKCIVAHLRLFVLNKLMVTFKRMKHMVMVAGTV